MPAGEGQKTVAQNRRALHDYSIEERYEAGIVLRGMEVKALREGKANIAEAYASVRDGEITLFGMHVAPYSAASTHEPLDPIRPRKLLLRRHQIEELAEQTMQKGKTLVPLRVYFTHGLAKVELGLAHGKRQVDKRHAMAERDAKREIDRAKRRRERGD
jgi:SsrA-binding protein